MPLPFQPARGSSMRPSIPLAKKPIGYGTRMVTHLPSTSANSEPERVVLVDPIVIRRFRAPALHGHALKLRTGDGVELPAFGTRVSGRGNWAVERALAQPPV